jgi:hypothetical protein
MFAMATAARPLRWRWRRLIRRGPREQKLQLPERVAMLRVQQAKGAYAMEALWRHMLQEPSQEVVCTDRHGLALAIAAIAIAEGDAVLARRHDRLVRGRGAVHIAAEVLEDPVGAVHDGLGEHDPFLLPWDLGERDAGQGAPGEVEEAAAEVLGEGTLRYQELLRPPGRHDPAAAIWAEPATGNQHVHVRVPFESARPSVQDGQCADLGSEEARIGTQCRERLEGRAEQHREELLLVGAHEPSELGWQREDDMEVGSRQQQLALLRQPPSSGVVPAAGTGAIATRVEDQVLTPALRALREMPAHLGCAAIDDVSEGAHVARQHGRAVALHVARPVLPHDVGQPGHGVPALQLDHEAIDDLLQPLCAGLRDVHVDLGRAQGLVPKHLLDGAQ